MERRAFLAASIAILATPLAAVGQMGKVWRIGYLSALEVRSAHGRPEMSQVSPGFILI